jgi:pSer/pThr/pTyr-binding forkhead associated (FHA) protein/thioredoxin reductase/formate hydrogenlyase subunit 6/NADH:ubiquinone oxidoreductase subunit I
MAIELSFETGGLAGTKIVTAANLIRFGREPQANDILLTSPMVSRRHALIERSVLGSHTLTVIGAGPSKFNDDPIVIVNNRPVAHVLASGDRLDFGGVQLRFAEAQIKVICVEGRAAGRELVLSDDATIGSDSECALVLDDPGVAPAHLSIEVTPLGFKVNAHERVMINGAPAANRTLAHGDEIKLGAATLRCLVTVEGEATAELPRTAGNAVGELVFIAGAAKSERLLLGDDQIILGTREDCTKVLADAYASPLHCAISKNGDQFIATDIGSTSGTLINGERITQGTVLAPGDLITIGTHVLEARLLGGVAQAVRNKTSFLTIAGHLVGSRFVIDGRVVKGTKISLGRSPVCDILVEDGVVSREHCVIEAEAGIFYVRDTSTHGTYLDDKRVVRQALDSTGVLRVGSALFRIGVRGEVCTLERADAVLAHAALDVAREQASRTRAAAPEAAGGPLKTVFHVEGAQLEHEIAARKKDLKRGAPAWRPSSDLARDAAVRVAVVLAAVGALAVGCVSIGFRGGAALVDHPVSAAHSSPAFVAKRSGTTPCAACHTAGARVAQDRCASCHTAFTARTEHHALTCGSCHHEHEAAPPHTALGARHACDGCHAGQHAKDFAGVGAPQKLAAPPIPPESPAFVGQEPTAAAIVALHASHSRVTVAGQTSGIGCTACHATQNGAELVPAKPGLACFRCHERPATATCDLCHGREHATSAAAVASTSGPAHTSTTMAAASSPLGAVPWALGLGLGGGMPALVFGAWMRTRRRRRQTALADELKAHPAEVVKRLVHSINDSKCVGCGLCVQACPASVLELVDHKSRIVNFDSCIQCKRCETACAFDALRMHDADKPPPMIPMPSIDAFHETPIAGMFLIGQASGTPQVKNATNLGRAVIQRMVQQGLRPGDGRAARAMVDVAIVGSGPAGLSAALTAIEAGLSYVVLEKEREFSWTIRNYYHKGKEVMAEPHDIDLEATLPHWDCSREELLGAWQQLVAQNRVDIRYQHVVADIKKEGPCFALQIADAKGAPLGMFTAARVVLAIGTLGNPRKLGCPGDDLEKVKNSLVDPDEWQGKSVLVVGGSDSAVEVVLALCKPERRNRVWLSTRGAKLEGIKPKNRKLLEDAIAANQVEVRHATTVAEVEPATVTLAYKEDGRREQLPNDVVFAMIGGNPPQKWLQQLGIPYVDKPHSWSPPRTDILARRTAEGLVQLRRLPRRDVPQRDH